MRRAWKFSLLFLLGPPVFYVLLAIVLGLIPIHRDPDLSADGEKLIIYLRTNGVHAEFVLPALVPHDWSREFPPSSMVDPARAPAALRFGWIAFGWGDRSFYLETPTWRQLRLRTALVALSGQGRGAMHVEYIERPEAYRSARIVVSGAQYRRLVAYVQAGFARRDGGVPIRIDQPGYFGTDAFFEGTGRYSLRLTSNEWVRRGLAQAGVRVPLWSPFDATLFWHLEH